MTTITVSPATASPSILANGTQPFTAVGYDQFGRHSPGPAQLQLGHRLSGVWIDRQLGTLQCRHRRPGPATSLGDQWGDRRQRIGYLVINAAPTGSHTRRRYTQPDITGTTTSLSVLGGDDGGEGEHHLYLDRHRRVPPDAAEPTFSSNGDNAAKDTTATFYQAAGATIYLPGHHHRRGRTQHDQQQSMSAPSSRNPDHDRTISPSSASLNLGGTHPFSATGYDQFGGATLVVQPSFT